LNTTISTSIETFSSQIININFDGLLRNLVVSKTNVYLMIYKNAVWRLTIFGAIALAKKESATLGRIAKATGDFNFHRLLSSQIGGDCQR